MRILRFVGGFILGWCILASQAGVPAVATVSLVGELETLWGSERDQEVGELTRSWLARPGQERIELFFMDKQVENASQQWAGKLVEVTGVFKTLDNGYRGLSVKSIEPREVGLTSISSTYTGNTPWVTLLCKFKDVPDEPKPAAYFSDMYGAEFPRLVSYWKEVSYNLIDVSNSTATPTWKTLPQNQDYYLYDSNNDGKIDVNFNRLNEDCIGVADASVDFRDYKGIQFIVNADLANSSWGGFQSFEIDGEYRVWMATWLPDWGYADLSIVEHEMGHGTA